MKKWNNIQDGDTITWDSGFGVTNYTIGDELDSDEDEISLDEDGLSWFQKMAEGNTEYNGTVISVTRSGKELDCE